MDGDPTTMNLLALGLMLFVALAFGAMGTFARLPKVTSYLLAGVAVGPFVLNWVSIGSTHAFEPLTEMAISLVLFQLGTYFQLRRVSRIFRRVLHYSFWEMAVTFFLVTLGTWLVGPSWEIALLLGALALATAPATTVLVFKELESEGPITEHAHAMVALNNLTSIVLFELLFVGIHFFHGKLEYPVAVELRHLARDLLGSAVLGILAGLWVSFFIGITSKNFRLMLFLSTTILVLGICHALNVPYLLTFLAMGTMVANSSYHGRQLIADSGRTVGFLCIIFFVTHGVELDLEAFTQVGLLGVTYLILRGVGKYVGVYLGGRRYQGEEPTVQRWMGLTLWSQAGAAIALAAIAVERDPALGHPIQTIVLGTVVVFEIVGPLLIRAAAIHGGEVPLAHAVVHTSFDLPDQLRRIGNGILIGLGRNPWKDRPQEELTANELMRKNIRPIRHNVTFDEVVQVIEHSHDNLFPVVGDEEKLVGVIRYRDLSSALFDPALGNLVRAADLTTAAWYTFYPETPIVEIQDRFNLTKDDCIPVVESKESGRFLGIVRRRDLMRHQLRSQPKNK